MTWLPNALSITRAVLALPIALLAYNGHWKMAFWLLIVAALTDFLDGAVAIALKCGTKWGKEFLDPACDAIMSTGAMLGWMLQADQLFRFSIGVLMLILGLWLARRKRQSQHNLIQLYSCLFLPLCYLITLYLLVYFYAYNAYGDRVHGIWWTAGTFIPLAAAIIKRRRFLDWAHGRL